MQTEIIKLNSLKHSITHLIENLSSKFRSQKDYDITVIVRECEEEKKLSSTEIDQEQPNEPYRHNVNFRDSPLVFGEDLSESYISLEDKIQSQPTFRTEKNLEESKIKKLLNKLSIKRRDLNIQQKENERQLEKKRKMISNYAQTDACIDASRLHSKVKIDDSCNGDSDRYSFKLNNLQIEESQNSQQEGSETDNDSEAGFLLEAHLNQAIELIERKKMNELQDFLYKFKEKFSFINLRTQTKWSLLMAYCKQQKLEYERAATNYNQVINTLKESPRIIIIELGDIYNRLGQCYFEIGEWNKGITAYSQALNHYKKNKKCSEYSNCITNLGVLYLEIGYYIEAQKCFLMTYNIKRNQDDKKSDTYLVSSLFHLIECNLKMKNYKQSQYLLGNVEQIIEGADLVQSTFEVILHTKKAKLQFFKGNLAEAEHHCVEALNLSSKHRIDPIEFGEALQLMGTLKQESGQFEKSKVYFQKALKAIQKYVAIDSIKIEILKKKIDFLTDRIQKNRQLKKKTAMIINKEAKLN